MAKRRQDTAVKTEMYARVQVVYITFILLALAIIARLVWVALPTSESAYNAERLESRIFYSDTIISRRGSILSRDGEPLATSILRYRLDFDMGSEGFDDEEAFYENADSLSKLLSSFFRDRSAASYRKRLLDERERHIEWVYSHDSIVSRSSDLLTWIVDHLRDDAYHIVKVDTAVRNHNPVQILPRAVDFNEWQTLSKYPILNGNMGLTFRKTILDQRVYPYGELGRRTLGMISNNLSEEDRRKARGQYGVEHIFADYLRGTNGRTLRQRIAPGFSTTVRSDSSLVASDGLDVVTTLDVDIQHAADAALRRQLIDQKAIWGTTIVMEVATGDILAMVNLGETAEGSGVYYEKENYALSRRIEPGSTFKLVSLLALIDDCGLPITTEYNAHEGRRVQVGGGRGPMIQDDHNIGAMIDMKTATAQSSNVYFADAIYQNYNNNREAYVEVLRRLGFDKSLGLDEWGERGTLMPPAKVKDWNASQLPNMGYGYAIEMPPIRILTLYNAVANGGRMVAPRLVKQVKSGDEIVEEFPTQVLVDKICSDASLVAVRECLEETALTGTTKSFFRDTLSLRVASKTGTAKVAQDGQGRGATYAANYYMGSVVAYFPADNPKYTVLTSIHTNRGRGRNYYGAALSGPVVRDVVNYIFYRDEEWHSTIETDVKRQVPVKVKGGSIEQVRRVADKFSPRISFTDRNGWGEAHMDTLLNVDVKTIELGNTMPNVVGMGLKDALYILESRGLEVRFTGRGTVQRQSIVAGQTIKAGQRVTLQLK